MIILDLHFCKFLKPHVNFSGFLCYLTFNIFKAETEKLYNNVSGFEKLLIKNNVKAKEYCFKFIYNGVVI